MSFSEPDFSMFLARSLLLLEEEQPKVYARMARAVGLRNVHCEVDGESIFIVGKGSRVGLTSSVVTTAVHLSTTHAVIDELLHGERTLEGAVFADDFVLRGPLDDVLAFHEGLQAYLGGAVRSPNFPVLLREYMGSRRQPSRRLSPTRSTFRTTAVP